MSDKNANLKEKFRLALTSTAKVISDDFDLKINHQKMIKKKI
jgi:cobaltochelatase CobT